MSIASSGGNTAPPLPAAWWQGDAAEDVRSTSAAEIRVAPLPAGDSLAKSITIHVEGRALPPSSSAKQQPVPAHACRLVAARAFAPGEMILAELAAAYAPATVFQSTPYTVQRGDAPQEERLAQLIQIAAPFRSPTGRAALVRLAAQLQPAGAPAAPCTAAASAACEEGGGGAAVVMTRAHLLAAAMQHFGYVTLLPSGSVPPPVRDATYGTAGAAGHAAGAEVGAPPAAAKRADPRRTEVYSLFIRASLVRPSCDPNTVVTVAMNTSVGTTAVVLTAARAIAAGEELTRSVQDTLAPLHVRRAYSLARFGAPCACTRCAAAVDDTIAIKCVACARGRVAVYAQADAVGTCVECAASMPDALERRQAAVHAAAALPTAAARVEALRAALMDADQAVLDALYTQLHELTTTEPFECGASDAAAAQACMSAMHEKSYLPPSWRLAVHCAHAAVMGACGDARSSSASWLAARELIACTYGAANTEPLVEMYTNLAAKPPRNSSEAHTAIRIQTMGLRLMSTA